LSRREWFQTQLRILSLERSHGPIYMRFEFEKAAIKCQLEGEVTRTLLAAKATRREHREYYEGWVQRARDDIQKAARAIPGFRFSVQREVVFALTHSYGMGASVIATVKGGRWSWREDIPPDPV
jgi:hypothetical protein